MHELFSVTAILIFKKYKENAQNKMFPCKMATFPLLVSQCISNKFLYCL